MFPDEAGLRRRWLYARYVSHLRQKSQHLDVSLSNRLNPIYTGATVPQLNERRNVFLIIDALTNMEFYQGLDDQLYKGLAFLEESDAASLPVGSYEIEGDAVFALVQEYNTRSADECRWEAHYTYTDIQYVVAGSEKMGW